MLQPNPQYKNIVARLILIKKSLKSSINSGEKLGWNQFQKLFWIIQLDLKLIKTIERRVRGNSHARCEAGENLKIVSKDYLSLLITLMTTNGQAPFVSMFMYLDEVPENQRDDLAMVIEEVLNQRIQGVKNEKGVWITPAFPKLLYVLDEDNINPTSKYYYLTVLAAKCTAKRMVPDYISAKMMKELKTDKTGNGVVYPCINTVPNISNDIRKPI